jgi:hypothetical protein
MLGWQINIYCQTTSPALLKADVLASWQTGLGGTDWLDELVKSGRAMLLLEAGGYPLRYAVRVADLLEQLPHLPTPHKGPLVIGEDYIMEAGWKGRITIDHAALSAFSPSAVVIVDAWDQS